MIGNKFVEKVADGESILLNIETGDLYSFNSTGQLIWSALKENKSKVEIVNMITGQFEINEREAMEEVENFIEDLKIGDIFKPNVVS